jgi:hypothetical protein
MGRDEDPKTAALRGLEQAFDVLDRVVLLDALPD